MNIKQTLAITVSAILLPSFIIAGKAYADGASGVPCTQIYGGNCQPGTVTITKTVQDPQTKQFVNNLGANDDKFTPGSTVTFHIDVTNNGNTNLSSVQVVDTLPQYLSFVSGPGSYDANTRTLTDTIGTLNANQTQELTVVGKLATTSSLPGNQGTLCLVNQATATQNGSTVMSTSQFCVALPTLSAPQRVTTAPPTGPEALPLLGLIPTALAGLGLRKKASK